MHLREFRIGPFSIAVNWVHAPPLRESNGYKYQPLQITAELTQIFIIAINTSRSNRFEPKRGAQSNIAQSHGVDVASLYECRSSRDARVYTYMLVTSQQVSKTSTSVAVLLQRTTID